MTRAALAGLLLLTAVSTACNAQPQQASGCSKARAAFHSLSPTLDAIQAGTKGAADLDAPLQAATLQMHAAAADATGTRAEDIKKSADDLDQFRADLQTASSWTDPAVQADSKTVVTDVGIVDADCK